MSKTAKLFVNGGSLAVRLPAECRFEGAEEISIRRDQVTRDLIFSPQVGRPTWAEFFALRDQVKVPADFMAERPLNVVQPLRDPFEES